MSFSRLFAQDSLVLVFLVLPSLARGDDDPFTKRPAPPVVGRWDLTVHGIDGDYPSWFEVKESGYRTLAGSFVGRVGSARPISRVEFENGRVHFSVPPQWEKRTDDQHLEGRLESDLLRGETTDEKGRRVTWEGHRPPSLPEPTGPMGRTGRVVQRA